MSHLNQMKNKMEKMEEKSKAAINGENYIEEDPQEYSDESGSDDGMYGGGHNSKKRGDNKSSKSQ